MKRWIGLFLVGLFLGSLWVVPLNADTAVGASTSYTFSVNVIYNDTMQPATGVQVKLEDVTKGTSCLKTTNSAGTVSFDPTMDLSAYSDGDELYISVPEPPNDYDSSLLIFTGSTTWNGHTFDNYLWRSYSTGQTHNVGYMNVVDDSYKYKFTQPYTVHILAGTPIHFTAHTACSMSKAPTNYPNAKYVDVTFTLEMWYYNPFKKEWQQKDIDTSPTYRISIPGSGGVSTLDVKIPTPTFPATPGTYKFYFRMSTTYLDENYQPIGYAGSGGSYTPWWDVKW